MNKRTRKLIVPGIVIALAVLIVVAIFRARTPGELNSFAQCLRDKGAVFYGAFWCPHCQDQKQLFGRSERLLPYVECSTPDGKGQTLECQNKRIESYPTWEFADGTREVGGQTLEELSQKSGCSLP